MTTVVWLILENKKEWLIFIYYILCVYNVSKGKEMKEKDVLKNKRKKTHTHIENIKKNKVKKR